MKEDTTHLDPTWMEKTGGYAKDMTLRDYYAGLAMDGVLASNETFRYAEIALEAYLMADAMLKERNK